MGEQSRYGIGETHGSKDTGSKQGIAAEGVEERVVGARDIGVNPLNVRELLDCKLADRTFVAFANPL
jgi:hypothetical protein